MFSLRNEKNSGLFAALISSNVDNNEDYERKSNTRLIMGDFEVIVLKIMTTSHPRIS